MIVPIFRVYPLGITYAISSGVFFFAAFILDEYQFSMEIQRGYFPYQQEGEFEISAWLLFKWLIAGVGDLFFLSSFVP
jgi:hypothetical protein